MTTHMISHQHQQQRHHRHQQAQKQQHQCTQTTTTKPNTRHREICVIEEDAESTSGEGAFSGPKRATTALPLTSNNVFSVALSGLIPTAPRTVPCHMTHYASNGMRVTMPTADKFRFDALLHNVLAAGFVSHNFEAISTFATIPLSEGGRRIFELPNAGGSSVSSEVISFELLHMMFNASLSRTEMELEYFPHGSKITDYSVMLNGECIGVSVTRAMKFRGTFNTRDAEALLNKKLYGVSASTLAVVQERWSKQILHVFAEHQYVADELRRAFDSLPFDVRSNTVVLCTVTTNARWIFTNFY